MIYKPLILTLFIMLPISANAAPVNTIHNLADFLSKDFVLENPHGESDGNSTIYVFNAKQSNEKSIFVSLTPATPKECLNNKPTFGDLPVNENRLQGMFTIPSIYDPYSRLQDYFIFTDGKNGCWQIGWGENGSRFQQLKKMAHMIIQSI